MSRRLLQIATGLLGLVPILTGMITMLGTRDPLYAATDIPELPVLDSNLRFFGGVWLALGIALLWLIPRIERETALFRAIWGAIFLGGIGRALSMVLIDAPPVPFIGFTALELIGAPLFIYWQSRVAAAAAEWTRPASTPRYRRAPPR
jgi:uncharacterized protein YjeT (DUF2065 family)